MSIWEQYVSIAAVTRGMFDTVSVSKIKDAQTALMTRLWAEHKDDMRELNKGGKPTEDQDKLIEKVALSVAKGFEG
ncbi:hypothetical protein D3C85_1798100 [compost metagenome]